ncbi:MAG: hypothetical protein WCI05_12140 [Myxococcales bacterium]
MRRLFLLPFVSFLGCNGGSPPPAVAPTVPVDASSPPVVAPPPDPVPALRPRGTLHGDPVRIAASGRSPERWLAFVGTPEIARAAWIVGETQDSLRPLVGWPVGVRVVGTIVRPTAVFILLETVALFDQPGAIRGVWVEPTGSAPPPVTVPLAGVRDLADLEQRLALPVPPPPTQADDALEEALQAVASSEAGLAQGLAEAGAEFFDVYQSLFYRRIEHLDATTIPSSPQKQPVFELLREAVSADQCVLDVCELMGSHGHAFVRFVDEKDRWVLRAIERDAMTPARNGGAPKRVPRSDSTTSTEAVLREQVLTVREVLGQAPLVTLATQGTPATIGVARTDLQYEGPAVVVQEGAYQRVFPLSSMSMVAQTVPDPRFEARFADIDGDGRTDVVLRVLGATSFTQVLLAPPATVQARELRSDGPTALAVFGASGVDAAVEAALAIPTRGVSQADACKLLSGAHTLAGFRRVSLPDARVLLFAEPRLPTFRPKVLEASALRAGDVTDVGKRCKELHCSDNRPYCRLDDGAYSEHYWFAWQDGRLRLAGAAFYRGS